MTAPIFCYPQGRNIVTEKLALLAEILPILVFYLRR
jgi:hypothetical protein